MVEPVETLFDLVIWQLTSTDLDSLHATLLSAGVGSISDLERAATQAHGLGLVVRSLVGLDRAAAMEAFTNFLENATYSAGQLYFLNLIVEHLTANGAMEAARLYESPFGPQPGRITCSATRRSTGSW